MANTASAKKRARQNKKRYVINLARKTALKTSIKKVLTAVEQKDANAAQLLKEAEASLARAKGKGTLHVRAARRKISRLAKKVAHVNRAA